MLKFGCLTAVRTSAVLMGAKTLSTWCSGESFLLERCQTLLALAWLISSSLPFVNSNIHANLDTCFCRLMTAAAYVFVLVILLRTVQLVDCKYRSRRLQIIGEFLTYFKVIFKIYIITHLIDV
jgi:hypothetical protein